VLREKFQISNNHKGTVRSNLSQKFSEEPKNDPESLNDQLFYTRREVIDWELSELRFFLLSADEMESFNYFQFVVAFSSELSRLRL
jgi:hypothetical protein